MRAESLTGKPERVIENSLDGDVVYKVSVGVPSKLFVRGQIVAAIKNFGATLPKPYSSMLELDDGRRSKLAHHIPYGDAVVHGEWDCDESYTAYAFIELPDSSETRPASRVLTGEDFRRADTLATDEEMSYEQMLAETLVQQLVSIHLVGTYVGWGVFYNDKLDRDMGTLGVQFNNYLSVFGTPSACIMQAASWEYAVTAESFSAQTKNARARRSTAAKHARKLKKTNVQRGAKKAQASPRSGSC